MIHNQDKNSEKNEYTTRVINAWNDMLVDTVDSTSLTNFKKSIMRVDITAHLKRFP